MSRAEQKAKKTVYTPRAFVHLKLAELEEEARKMLPDPEKSMISQIKFITFKGSWMASNFDASCPFNVSLKFEISHPIQGDNVAPVPIGWAFKGATYMIRDRDDAPKTDIDGDDSAPVGAASASQPISPAAAKLMEEHGLAIGDVTSGQDVDKVTVPMVKAILESRKGDDTEDVTTTEE